MIHLQFFSFFTVVNTVSPVTCLHSLSSYGFQILEVVHTFKANAEAHLEAEIEAKAEAENKDEARTEAGG